MVSLISQVIVDEQALVIINLRKKAKVVLTRDSEAHQVNYHARLHSHFVLSMFHFHNCSLFFLSLQIRSR